MSRRVVVTGVGCISPLGLSADALWDSCESGRSGVDEVSQFPGAGFPTTRVAEVRDFEPRDFVAKRKALKLMNSSIKFAVASARLALEGAGEVLEGEDDPAFGVFMGARVMPSEFAELEGSVFCGLDEERRFDTRRYGEGARAVLFPLSMLKNLPNMASAHIAINHRALGSNDTTTAGAVSGLEALVEGADAIRRGELDRALVGGTDCLVDPVNLAALSCRGIVSPTGTARPFDGEGNGCVLGEGAAVLYLEERDRAIARGARVLAEVVSVAESFDPTLLDPGADAKADRQAPALAVRALEGARPDFVLSSACGIPEADRAEARCIGVAVGRDVPVGSVSGIAGFAGAATSAVTMAAAVGCLVRSRPWRAWGCRQAGPEMPCAVLDETARIQGADLRRVLVTAHSLTGQRAAVVFEGGAR